MNDSRRLVKFGLYALVFSIVCVSAVYAEQSGAEKILSRLPDETIGFVATSGGDELKPAFEKTILGKLWYDASTQNFWKLIKTEISKKLRQETGNIEQPGSDPNKQRLKSNDPNKPTVFDLSLNLASSILQRPCVFAVCENKADKESPIFGVFIADAGAKKDEFAKAIQQIEGLTEKGGIVDVNVAGLKMHWFVDSNDEQGYWGWVGNYLVFAINDKQGLAIKNLKGSKPQTSVNYFAGIEGNGDCVAAYCDIRKLLGCLETMVRNEGGQKDAQKFNTAMSKLGLLGINNIKIRAGFAGPDIVLDKVMELSGAPAGIVDSLKPVEAAMLDLVDSRLVNATAFNIDTSLLYDTIMETIKAVADGNDWLEVQNGIAGAEKEIGFSIRNDLLTSISAPAVVYSLQTAAIPEAPTGGLIAVIKSPNTQSFEKAMKALADYAVKDSNNMIQSSSEVVDGKTYNTFVYAPLALAQIMPTWTIVDNHIVIGMNRPLCVLAAKKIASPDLAAASMRKTVEFQKAAGKLPANLFMISYTNSKVQFIELMTGLQQFWPILTMGAAQAGFKLPFVLPSLSHIAEQMTPACGYGWSGEKVLRYHYRGCGIEQSIGATAGGAIGIGIMMPALARTRQIAQRVTSGSNLSSIGIALMIYASENNGKYPPDLQTLINKADLSPKVLISSRAPKTFKGEHFIYITGQNAKMPPDNVLVYENPEYCRDGVNVLYNDGHVAFEQWADFKKALEQTYKRLGRPMPEIKWR